MRCRRWRRVWSLQRRLPTDRMLVNAAGFAALDHIAARDCAVGADDARQALFGLGDGGTPVRGTTLRRGAGDAPSWRAKAHHPRLAVLASRQTWMAGPSA